MVVLGRNLAPPLLRSAFGHPRDAQSLAAGLRRGFEELGATYVKFGQLVGSSPGAFGQPMSNEFRRCLDTGPAVPFKAVRSIVEQQLGAPLRALFAAFDERPFAAASIAVVHRATLHDGRLVAVKVVRPDIVDVVAADLAILEPVFRSLARQGVAAAEPFYRYLVILRRQVAEEMDLTNELAAMEHFRPLFAEAGIASIKVPDVHPELSTTAVLTMEFLDGVPIDDPARIAELGVDPRPLMQDLLRSWLLTGLRDGVFHADIHAGNLLLLRDGRLGLIDWGIVARLDDQTRHMFRRFVAGCLGDDDAWREVADFLMRMTGTSRDATLSEEDVILDVRSRIEPILTRPFEEIELQGAFGGNQLGAPVRRRSLLERLRRAREMRKALRASIDEGVMSNDYGRTDFVLLKQLLYFERYGKMYLHDSALLGDREFLQSLLVEEGGEDVTRRSRVS